MDSRLRGNDDCAGTAFVYGARQFEIYERKARLISAAPFPDRVVHHALMNLMEPAIDPHFLPASFACRKDKGVHKAVDFYQHCAKRYAYAMKLDIRQYFPSIDHQILKSQVSQWLIDPDVLWLMNTIIDNSPESIPQDLVYTQQDDLLTPVLRKAGIPIGNLTSQFLANLYLNEFDHWVKNELKVPAYMRYVDDLFLLADNKQQLWQWSDQIQAYLREQLRLGLHERKVQLIRTSEKLDVLGYQVSRTKRWLRNENGYRARRKLKSKAKAYAKGQMARKDIQASVQAWIGHAQHGETHGLRRQIFSEVSFSRSG